MARHNSSRTCDERARDRVVISFNNFQQRQVDPDNVLTHAYVLRYQVQQQKAKKQLKKQQQQQRQDKLASLHAQRRKQLVSASCSSLPSPSPLSNYASTSSSSSSSTTTKRTVDFSPHIGAARSYDDLSTLNRPSMALPAPPRTARRRSASPSYSVSTIPAAGRNVFGRGRGCPNRSVAAGAAVSSTRQSRRRRALPFASPSASPAQRRCSLPAILEQADGEDAHDDDDDDDRAMPASTDMALLMVQQQQQQHEGSRPGSRGRSMCRDEHTPTTATAATSATSSARSSASRQSRRQDQRAALMSPSLVMMHSSSSRSSGGGDGGIGGGQGAGNNSKRASSVQPSPSASLLNAPFPPLADGGSHEMLGGYSTDETATPCDDDEDEDEETFGFGPAFGFGELASRLNEVAAEQQTARHHQHHQKQSATMGAQTGSNAAGVHEAVHEDGFGSHARDGDDGDVDGDNDCDDRLEDAQQQQHPVQTGFGDATLPHLMKRPAFKTGVPRYRQSTPKPVQGLRALQPRPVWQRHARHSSWPVHPLGDSQSAAALTSSSSSSLTSRGATTVDDSAINTAATTSGSTGATNTSDASGTPALAPTLTPALTPKPPTPTTPSPPSHQPTSSSAAAGRLRRWRRYTNLSTAPLSPCLEEDAEAEFALPSKP
ncbi:hypothetical protein PTSG_03598 [Salpingoeca rosetta]|uniref:Uncharacterized protein n=1 Tax=Salpingoeca rosetta (strain ATCC 50818 / BSB-021) TaxID=946362 RepID=F2U623_SALR5|nr:uncharacterized protein PTSG_03598 [Salpingoeca rosetta]EGD82964.1 hypothetical protein PTSG_03598 [Salpingoeca rosetta]|eukprot:XP_004995328.1 hypothetical protein PTSG_03598 [Salpingoeca rosetta]